jgi:hypothetical protein
MRKTLLLYLSVLLTCRAWAQEMQAHPASTNPAPTSEEITVLRQELAMQRQQIQQQQEEIHELRREMQSWKATGQPIQQQQPLSAVREIASTDHNVSAVAPSGPAPALTDANPRAQHAAESEPQSTESQESPLSFRIGGADFTPGGFMDFTAIFRSTNVGSGIGTAFGSIPFSNTPGGQLAETRFSAQNSRISLKVTGKLGKNDVTGYVESDFLGFQPSNGFVTSNSNSLRMRLYWIDLKRDKWEFLGGQSWSFMNPNRSGLSAMPSDIFYTQNMDTNYQVGLTWTRAAQFRVVYHPNSEWSLGLALENPEQYIGSSVVLPSALANAYAGQLDNGSLTGTPNLHPDIIPKIAYDALVKGRHFHVETAGLLRSFKVFNPGTNSSSTLTGGGGSVNANLELLKNFHLIVNTFYSDGGGRYIFGLGPDLIIRPDGTPSLVHSGSGIGGFEYQATSHTMLYGYYGGAYYQRNFSLDPATGKFAGFGFPGSTANRAIQEGTFGVVQTFWKNPHYGALQLITQYSYLTRSPWSVIAGQPKNAHTNLGYVDLRYVLP